MSYERDKNFYLKKIESELRHMINDLRLDDWFEEMAFLREVMIIVKGMFDDAFERWRAGIPEAEAVEGREE